MLAKSEIYLTEVSKYGPESHGVYLLRTKEQYTHHIES